MSKSVWSVYMIRCADGSIYCGITTDVDRRFSEHSEGAPKGAKYTRGKGPLELIYQRKVGSRSDATKEEMRIKKLTRAAKLLMLDSCAQSISQ